MFNDNIIKALLLNEVFKLLLFPCCSLYSALHCYDNIVFLS